MVSLPLLSRLCRLRLRPRMSGSSTFGMQHCLHIQLGILVTLEEPYWLTDCLHALLQLQSVCLSVFMSVCLPAMFACMSNSHFIEIDKYWLRTSVQSTLDRLRHSQETHSTCWIFAMAMATLQTRHWKRNRYGTERGRQRREGWALASFKLPLMSGKRLKVLRCCQDDRLRLRCRRRRVIMKTNAANCYATFRAIN